MPEDKTVMIMNTTDLPEEMKNSVWDPWRAWMADVLEQMEASKDAATS